MSGYLPCIELVQELALLTERPKLSRVSDFKHNGYSRY